MCKNIYKENYTDDDFVRIVYGFCHGGYMNPGKSNVFSERLTTIKRRLISNIHPDNLIKLTWALCASQSPSKPSLLAPDAIMQIPKVNREMDITINELIDLHQIVGYTKIAISKKWWPESLTDCIAKGAVLKAKEIFKQQNICLYPTIQNEIYAKLAERSKGVQKDYLVDDAWRVDIMENNVGVLITSKGQLNDIGELRGRDYVNTIGLKNTLKNLYIIDEESWKTLNEDEKEEKYEKIIKFIETA